MREPIFRPISGLFPAALLGTALALTGCGQGAGGDAGPTLEEVFAAVERYRDVDVALADGYFRDPLDTCETPAHLGFSADLGAKGIPYLNRELLGVTPDQPRLDAQGTHTDFLRPAILLYEPQADGSVTLVGVSNHVSAAAWEAQGNRRPPRLADREYRFVPEYGPRSIPAHYDLYVWLRENPDGQYSPYNPAVSCRHHVLVMPMLHPDESGELHMPEPHPHIFGLPLGDDGPPTQTHH